MAMKAAAAASTPLLSFSSKSHLSRRFPQFDRGRSFPTTSCCCCGARPSLSSYATYASLLRPKPKAEASQNTRRPMLPPYNVLITGSTKGIGFALAKEFLRAGDNVVICSRSAERVESTVRSLREEFGEQHVWGTKCDVREGKDVKDLVAFAQKNLIYIDIWINNAGSNAYSYKPLAEASDEDLIEVVTTNTLGLMICCREAIKMMLDQPRGGHVFNIDGAGSDGRPTPRFAAYGATKRSVVHLTKSLQVAEYLVPNIRSIPTNGSVKPTYIRFLTGIKAYSQIFSRFAFGARRNRYMLED